MYELKLSIVEEYNIIDLFQDFFVFNHETIPYSRFVDSSERIKLKFAHVESRHCHIHVNTKILSEIHIQGLNIENELYIIARDVLIDDCDLQVVSFEGETLKFRGGSCNALSIKPNHTFLPYISLYNIQINYLFLPFPQMIDALILINSYVEAVSRGYICRLEIRKTADDDKDLCVGIDTFLAFARQYIGSSDSIERDINQKIQQSECLIHYFITQGI